ncbi:hypothetical protein HYU19_03670 [Candidatus Woesearchaeota archaeon]|nr:hypothetical protein [Candidatus Woesearchaeota archaeon]
MAQEIVKHQVESLEFQVSQVYGALQHAATTGQDRDAFWAWAVYQALDVHLKSDIFPQVRNGSQDIPRQTPFDRQFLQYVVMRGLPDYLKTAAAERQQKTKGTASGRGEIPEPDELLQALIADPSSSYRDIVTRASNLTAAGKVESIFMAVEQIRELYPV